MYSYRYKRVSYIGVHGKFSPYPAVGTVARILVYILGLSIEKKISEIFALMRIRPDSISLLSYHGHFYRSSLKKK